MPSGDVAGGAPVYFRGVTKTYGSLTVVADVSITIERGSFMTLLGPSGSGKTTLLKMLAGFVSPTRGQILVGDRDVTHLTPNKRNVGLVFQNYALFPHMSVADNVAFPLKMRKVGRRDIAHRVDQMLDLVRLSELRARLPNQLSGGQQQRVALARTLIFRPSVLLMDEPLSALDKKLREHMQLEIKHLHEQLGVTIIYVTHDQTEALVMSDFVAVMRDGRVEQIGHPRDVYQKPATRFVADFVGEINFFVGQIDKLSDRDCLVRTDGGLTIQAPVPTSTASLSCGQVVSISVRPEAVRITHDASGQNVFPAVVEEQVFLGDRARIRLKLDGGHTLIAQESTLTEHSLEKGTAVKVSLPVDAIHLLIA